jgi:hypothetical protein
MLSLQSFHGYKLTWVWQVVDSRTGYLAGSTDLYQQQYI